MDGRGYTSCMTIFLLYVVSIVLIFGAGYLVGSKNPAQSVKDKLTAEIKSKL